MRISCTKMFLQVSKEQMVTNLKNLGFQGDADRVFRLLDADHSGFITLEEMDEEANQALIRGDVELALAFLLGFLLKTSICIRIFPQP